MPSQLQRAQGALQVFLGSRGQLQAYASNFGLCLGFGCLGSPRRRYHAGASRAQGTRSGGGMRRRRLLAPSPATFPDRRCSLCRGLRTIVCVSLSVVRPAVEATLCAKAFISCAIPLVRLAVLLDAEAALQAKVRILPTIPCVCMSVPLRIKVALITILRVLLAIPGVSLALVHVGVEPAIGAETCVLLTIPLVGPTVKLRVETALHAELRIPLAIPCVRLAAVLLWVASTIHTVLEVLQAIPSVGQAVVVQRVETTFLAVVRILRAIPSMGPSVVLVRVGAAILAIVRILRAIPCMRQPILLRILAALMAALGAALGELRKIQRRFEALCLQGATEGLAEFVLVHLAASVDGAAAEQLAEIICRAVSSNWTASQ
mmetsp:Transcript_116634/g.371005  ORF Transcript_116634/g.371005 Transcript_116634/m.371005 type:complete len:375 (-) Transcript_116634:2245-3369(-)